MTNKPLKIILIGMMGCGKTSLARALSKKLNLKFIDCDEIFENREKIAISEFFSLYGEEKFRQIESSIIKDVLNDNNVVISLGGGAILKACNRQLIFSKDNMPFYLQTSAEVIYNRLKDDNSRPLLKNCNVLDEIKKIISQREKYYKLARFSVLTDDKTIRQVCDEIIEIVSGVRNG